MSPSGFDLTPLRTQALKASIGSAVIAPKPFHPSA
jgi:hypothetical protein